MIIGRAMLKPVVILSLAAGWVAGVAASAAAPPGPPSAPAMLPDRLLRCSLGRATNLDPAKLQTTADVIYDGKHDFVLFLPAIPVRQGPPPDATDPPEPVDARTRILSDPDGLASSVPARFDRVVDYWPQRVELATTIADPLTNVIIVHDISAADGKATLFMTRARDAASPDLERVYQAPCSISSGAEARAGAGAGKGNVH